MPYNPFTQPLNDIFLEGYPLNGIDDLGCVWTVTDVEGWWEPPPVDLPDETRSYAEDGSYAVAGRYLARPITITGVILPPQNNIHAVYNARRVLTNIVNLVRSSGTLLFNEITPKTSQVMLADQVKTNISQLNGTMTYEIPLRAADPRKYAPEASFADIQLSGGISQGWTFPLHFPFVFQTDTGITTETINNEGNYDTGGIIRIYGPVTNPSLEHVQSGKTLAFNGIVNAGSYLEIDLDTHLVTLDGGESRRNLLANRSQWFRLVPGTNTIHYNGLQHLASRPHIEGSVNLALNPSMYTRAGLVEKRRNLVSNPGPAYEDTNWTQSYAGSAPNTSLMQLINNDESFMWLQWTTATSTLEGVRYLEQGTYGTGVYSASIQARTSNARSVSVSLQFYDSSTTSLALKSQTYSLPGYGSIFNSDGGSWTTISVENLSVPAGATQVAIRVNGTGWAKNEELSVRHLMVENSATATTYFDGDTPPAPLGYTYAWSGEENASQSYEAQISLLNYSSVNATVAQADSPSLVGKDNYVAVVTTKSTANRMYTTAQTDPSTKYMFSAYVYGPAGTYTVNSSPTTGVVDASANFTLTANSWQRVYLSVTSTSSDISRQFGLQGPNGVSYYTDRWMIEASDLTTPSTYFDGNTVGASWSGAYNNSTSIRPEQEGIDPTHTEITYHAAWLS